MAVDLAIVVILLSAIASFEVERKLGFSELTIYELPLGLSRIAVGTTCR
jgi:hypothetical protein